MLPLNASKNKGYKVPIKTVAVAVVRNKLFIRIALSLLSILNCIFCSLNEELLKAYKINGPPIAIAKIIKIKTPLDGSDANAWTEVNSPDLTIKVPRSENEKAKIDKRIIQFTRTSFFSNTLTECNNAVAINQGINDAFSTGSQNHHPPHPNS